MIKKLLRNYYLLLLITLLSINYTVKAQISYNTTAWDFELASGVVYNGGTADIVTAWTQIAGFALSSDQAHSGTYSCKMDFTSTSTSGKFQTYRSTTGKEGDFTIASDESYTAIAWIYFESGTPSGSFRLTLQKSGVTPVTANIDISSVPLGVWTKVMGAFNANPAVSTELWSAVQYSTVPTGTVVYVDDISVVRSATLGIEDYQQLEDVNIYPNPVNNELSIECPYRSEIGVYNLLGVKVKSVNITEKNFRLPVEDLSSGLYIVKVESEGKFYSKKIQVK